MRLTVVQENWGRATWYFSHTNTRGSISESVRPGSRSGIRGGRW